MTATIERIAGRGLRVTALEIRNLWGIAEAVIRPGKRNVIRGANGTGKSSVLNAIQLALGGGSLGKYQRLGAEEEPEIVLEVAGPNDFIRVERTGDKPPKVLRRVGESEAFERVSSPATYIKNLFDPRGANPFLFLSASDDERAQLLLEALDLQMNEAELERVLGDDAELAREIPTTLHPLVRLALIHDSVYKARRGCNVDRDSKLKAAEQLKRSVPAEKLDDATARIEELAGEIESDAVELAKRKQEIGHEAATQKRDLEQSFETEKAELEQELERFASKARAEVEARIKAEGERVAALIDGHRTAMLGELSHVSATAAKGRDDLEPGYAKLGDDRAELARLKERQAERERHENTRSQIAEFEAAAGEHEAESKRLSALLTELEFLKRRLVEDLPIDGLDISGKEIRVNGVPWRDLNKAQQGAVAAVVAIERAKRSRLPVVFFDEAEQFDEEHLDAIAEIVEESETQLFVAVVAREGELSFEADGELAGEVEVDAPEDPVVNR